MASYNDLAIQKLRGKRVVANWIIGLLRGPWADDPRAEGALEHYRAERAKINAALREKQGIDPPAQQAGLNTLNLSARRM